MSHSSQVTTESFIEKAIKVHGDLYDYSLVTYKNNSTKIKIICKIHGVFGQQPNNHLQGKTCLKCSYVNRAVPMTTDEFIRKARSVHGDRYNYSESMYDRSNKPVNVICDTHGIFSIRPNDHLSGRGCLLCGKQSASIKLRSNTESFIEKAVIVHGNRYDYNKVVYGINSSDPVIIVCHKHGDFLQRPGTHLMGHGCPICKLHTIADSRRHSTDIFLQKAVSTHGNTYEYDRVRYIDAKTTVEIKCKIHGYFFQEASAHLSGKGCNICCSSSGERMVASYLDDHSIPYEREKMFDSCKNKRKLPFDFYIKSMNTLIEYHGIQHYEPVVFFGGLPSYENRVHIDNIKRKYATDNGIIYIEIRYDDDVASVLDKSLTIDTILEKV